MEETKLSAFQKIGFLQQYPSSRTGGTAQLTKHDNGNVCYCLNADKPWLVLINIQGTRKAFTSATTRHRCGLNSIPFHFSVLPTTHLVF
jgi:hypothetical protein